MTMSPALVQLFQSLSLAGLVTLLVNLIAPFLESYVPFAKPSSGTHDATLRVLNFLLNIGLALGAAALLSQLNTGQDVLAVIGYGIAQATGSHFLYATGNRQSPASTAPTSAPANAAAVVSVPSVFTPPSTPSSQASIATLAAPSAAAVADAINGALAAQASAGK